MGAFLIGVGLGILFSIGKSKKKQSNNFICGHCNSKDTLKIQKLRDRDVFTCSFCERVIDETLLKITNKDDYEILKNYPEQYESFKNARKEGKKYEISRRKDHTDSGE